MMAKFVIDTTEEVRFRTMQRRVWRREGQPCASVPLPLCTTLNRQREVGASLSSAASPAPRPERRGSFWRGRRVSRAGEGRATDYRRGLLTSPRLRLGIQGAHRLRQRWCRDSHPDPQGLSPRTLTLGVKPPHFCGPQCVGMEGSGGQVRAMLAGGLRAQFRLACDLPVQPLHELLPRAGAHLGVGFSAC